MSYGDKRVALYKSSIPLGHVKGCYHGTVRGMRRLRNQFLERIIARGDSLAIDVTVLSKTYLNI